MGRGRWGKEPLAGEHWVGSSSALHLHSLVYIGTIYIYIYIFLNSP